MPFAFQQQQSSHQPYSHSAPAAQPQPHQQSYIKPWSSSSSSSSTAFLQQDQQPYMTNALFYPPGPTAQGSGADMYLSRISGLPQQQQQQQPYPGPYPMMGAPMAGNQMYHQPYYQPFFPTHRTSVSHAVSKRFFFVKSLRRDQRDTSVSPIYI